MSQIEDPKEVMKKIAEDDRWWNELTKAEQDQIEFKYQRAIMQLIMHYGFFGFVAARLSGQKIWIKSESQMRGQVGGKDFRTMATDGRRIILWPQYVLYNDEKVIIATILHEIMHVILLHIQRGIGYNQELANIAMDHVINMMVNDMAIELGNMGKGTKLDNDAYRNMRWYLPCPPAYHNEKYREKNGDPWLWENVYKDLLKQQDPNTQKMLNQGCSIDEATGGGGLKGVDPNQGMTDSHDFWNPGNRPADEKGEADQTPFDRKEAQEMIRDAHVSAANTKTAGKLPAAIERIIDEWLHPPLPWQRLVQNYLKPIQGDWGYQPGDIRFPDPMPWFIPEHKLDYILISIDTSGSMSEAEVGTAITQARHLLRGFPQTKGILCQCDADVSYWDDLENTYTLNKRYGYGGTSFHPPFQKAIEENIQDKISLHIYFTDGYGWFPDDNWLKEHKVTYDTLWVITNNDVAFPEHTQYRGTRLNPLTGSHG